MPDPTQDVFAREAAKVAEAAKLDAQDEVAAQVEAEVEAKAKAPAKPKPAPKSEDQSGA